MIIDTSALMAILLDEPQGPSCLDILLDAPVAAISAANLLELSIVIDSRGSPVLSRELDRIRRALGIHVEPVTAGQVELARAAHRDFGRGSGHPARLNFGDCFAYALAIERDVPLLWVGDDFGHTDVQPAG